MKFSNLRLKTSKESQSQWELTPSWTLTKCRNGHDATHSVDEKLYEYILRNASEKKIITFIWVLVVGQSASTPLDLLFRFVSRRALFGIKAFSFRTYEFNYRFNSSVCVSLKRDETNETENALYYRHSGFEVKRTHDQDTISSDVGGSFAQLTRLSGGYKYNDNNNCVFNSIFTIFFKCFFKLFIRKWFLVKCDLKGRFTKKKKNYQKSILYFQRYKCWKLYIVWKIGKFFFCFVELRILKLSDTFE